MAGKRKIVKTLYVSCLGTPLCIRLTEGRLERVKELQKSILDLSLKRHEFCEINMYLRKGTIRIFNELVNIGVNGPDGFCSFISELNLKYLDDLPEVYFSRMFLYYLKDDKLLPGKSEKFSHILKLKHKELLVWKHIEGSA